MAYLIGLMFTDKLQIEAIHLWNHQSENSFENYYKHTISKRTKYIWFSLLSDFSSSKELRFAHSSLWRCREVHNRTFYNLAHVQYTYFISYYIIDTKVRDRNHRQKNTNMSYIGFKCVWVISSVPAVLCKVNWFTQPWWMHVMYSATDPSCTMCPINMILYVYIDLALWIARPF